MERYDDDMPRTEANESDGTSHMDFELGPQVKEWLVEMRRREDEERRGRLLTETRTVRFTKEDAEQMSRWASQLDLTDAEYIRLVCSSRRPDVVAAGEAIRRLCDLIHRFAGAFKTPGTSDADVARLRHVAEEMERQAQEICAGYSQGRP